MFLIDRPFKSKGKITNYIDLNNIYFLKKVILEQSGNRNEESKTLDDYSGGLDLEIIIHFFLKCK
jgi:hypothetical protein